MVPGEVAMARFGEIPSLTSYFLHICTPDAYFFSSTMISIDHGAAMASNDVGCC